MPSPHLTSPPTWERGKNRKNEIKCKREGLFFLTWVLHCFPFWEAPSWTTIMFWHSRFSPLHPPFFKCFACPVFPSPIFIFKIRLFYLGRNPRWRERVERKLPCSKKPFVRLFDSIPPYHTDFLSIPKCIRCSNCGVGSCWQSKKINPFFTPFLVAGRRGGGGRGGEGERQKSAI